jgi:acyl-CoA thioester hydrolase
MNIENSNSLNKTSEIKREYFSVRDYECDVQGIVNNSVYLNYLEHARHKYLKSYGIDFVELSKADIDLVVIEIHIKYLSSLTFDDDFYVETQFAKISKLKFLFKQKIFKTSNDNKIILDAQVIGCSLDKKSRRPIQIENSTLALL